MSAAVSNGTASGLLSEHIHDAVTPEKLALLKLGAINESTIHDTFSEPGTPGERRGDRRHRGSSSFATFAGGSALARTSRQASSMTTRRTSSFMQSHRRKMSLELSAHAEKRFVTLMELMDSAFKEATSVKEYWSQLMSERESDDHEREQLLLQIEEISQTLEQKDSQHDHHRRQALDRKKELDKLMMDLTATLSVVADQKSRIADRELEIERVNLELSDVRASLSRSHIEHEQMRASFEASQTKCRLADGELVHVKDELEKVRNELRSLNREHSELGSRNSSLNLTLESVRKDNNTLTERVRVLDVEKTELSFEKDKSDANLRKQSLKTEEAQRELTHLTDHNERLHREHVKLKEVITRLELERDEHQAAATRSRTEAKEYATKLEEAEEQRSDALLKIEQSKRQIVRKEEALTEKESEITDLQHRLDGKNEEFRTVLVERDQLTDDLASEHKALHDTRHKISGLEESLDQAEAKSIQQQSEIYAATERIRQVERDRDDFHDKHHKSVLEVESLKAKILLLHGDVRAANEKGHHLDSEVARYKQRYEEVTETIEEWNNDSGDLEFEIESLRVMLREARDQKEKAIAARNTADRERDEHIALYEEKCRELERFEESGSRAAYVHAGAHGHSSSTRTVSTKTARTSSMREHMHGEDKVEEDAEV